MLHTTPPCAHGFDQKYLAAPVSNLNLTCWDKTYLATSVLSRHLPGCPAAGSPSRPWPSWICFRFTLRFHSQVSHSQELPSLKDWKHTWALACKRSDCKTFARRCLVDQRQGRVHSLSLVSSSVRLLRWQCLRRQESALHSSAGGREPECKSATHTNTQCFIGYKGWKGGWLK